MQSSENWQHATQSMSQLKWEITTIGDRSPHSKTQKIKNRERKLKQTIIAGIEEKKQQPAIEWKIKRKPIKYDRLVNNATSITTAAAAATTTTQFRNESPNWIAPIKINQWVEQKLQKNTENGAVRAEVGGGGGGGEGGEGKAKALVITVGPLLGFG